MREQLRQNLTSHDATVLLSSSHEMPMSSSHKMPKQFWIIALVLTLALLSVQSASASSLTLTFSSDPSGIALGGSGTSAASITFGNVQAFGGTVPSGVTEAINGTTNWTLSTPIDVRVTKTGLGNSANYTMTAQLQTSGLTCTWALGPATLTSAFPAMVTAAGAYGSTTPYTFSLTIPFSASAGTVSNTLDIIVTAN
jgi:hypothetical protein